MPTSSPATQAVEDPRPRPSGDDRLHSPARGDAGAVDLAAHAPATQRADGADLHALEVAQVVDLGDEPGIGVLARVGGVEAVGVGEQDEQIGLHQQSDLRRQGVVVAEAQLVGGRGVVLVDDRDDLPLQQPVERVARVEILRARRHVERGEEHLRRHDVLVSEQLGVDVEQMSLAHGSGGLQVDHGRRPAPAAQHAHPGRDRPRGDQEHPVAGGVQLAHLGHQAGDRSQAERARARW